MLSIPAVLRSENRANQGGAAAGPSGEGEVSNSDLFGVLSGLSGLAGDVGTTINSLTTGTGKNGTPVNKPAIQPPDPDKRRNWLLIGAAVTAVVGLVWFLKKG